MAFNRLSHDLFFLVSRSTARFLGVSPFAFGEVEDPMFKLYTEPHFVIRLPQYAVFPEELFGKDLKVYLKGQWVGHGLQLNFIVFLDSTPALKIRFSEYYRKELEAYLRKVCRHWQAICDRFKWKGYSPFSFIRCDNEGVAVIEDTKYSDFPLSIGYVQGRLYLKQNPRFSESIVDSLY